LSEISQMICFAQRERYGITGPVAKKGAKVPPFLEYDIVSIETDPRLVAKTDHQRSKVAAWELETVSHFLKLLWTDAKKKATPAGQNLTAVVLEHETFENLNFSGANLRTGVLYNATFKGANFRGTDLTDAFIQDAVMDGADLSDIVHFQGSVWQGEKTKWWNAACISRELQDYLMKIYPPPTLARPSTTCGL
jgi:hypothetical protein